MQDEELTNRGHDLLLQYEARDMAAVDEELSLLNLDDGIDGESTDLTKRDLYDATIAGLKTAALLASGAWAGYNIVKAVKKKVKGSQPKPRGVEDAPETLEVRGEKELYDVLARADNDRGLMKSNVEPNHD